jgi:putative addiction module component (TIGR02574 family)
MLTEAEVLKHAMELPASQRSAIARRLLESLEPADADEDEVAQAWADEIEARAAAYDRGETQSVDGREAIEQIRRSLHLRRNGHP